MADAKRDNNYVPTLLGVDISDLNYYVHPGV